MLHKNITVGDVHYIQQWSVANSAARLALSVASTDIGKICLQTDTNVWYLLTNNSPMTWEQLSGTTPVSQGGTGQTSYTNGQLLIGNTSTGGLDKATLTAGSNITITNGAGAITIGVTAGSGGITLATPQNSTSGTSIDFTGIAAGTKRITVNFNGVSTNGTSTIIVQLGVSGTPETTNYKGDCVIFTGGIAHLAMSSGFLVTEQIPAATDLLYGGMTLNLMDSTNNTWTCTGAFGVTGTQALNWCAGAKSLAGAVNMIRITTTGGVNTFDAGVINIQTE